MCLFWSRFLQEFWRLGSVNAEIASNCNCANCFFTALPRWGTFLCRKKWGPQRNNFGGRYGFPSFYRVFIFTIVLESVFLFLAARKVPQEIFFWLWSCTLFSSLNPKGPELEKNQSRLKFPISLDNFQSRLKGHRENTLKTPWKSLKLPENTLRTPWKYPENTLKFMTFSTFSLCPLWVCPLHLSNLRICNCAISFVLAC